MKIAGQRILIFGDSLSHHGQDNAPEAWDVDEGSNRASGQPGDLLGSMLLENGAAAVRIDARVSRSASNFFGREASQALLSADAAFQPTLVFIVLGTNDIGLNLQADAAAFEQLREFFSRQGAEVWAIGPFTYASAALNIQANDVVSMMQSVFGGRFIDGRPLSVQEGRAGDGVHFGAQAAAVTAANMLAEIQSKSTLLAKVGGWRGFAIGAGALVVGAMAFQWWKRGRVALEGLDELERPTPARDLTKAEAEEEVKRLILEGDADDLDVAQDLAMQHEIRLSALSTAWARGGSREGLFRLGKGAEVGARGTAVQWKIAPHSHNECEVRFSVTVNNVPVSPSVKSSWMPSRPPLIGWEETYGGGEEYCKRAAASQAWSIAKEIKPLITKLPEPRKPSLWTDEALEELREPVRAAVEKALDRDNSEPAELYGPADPEPIDPSNPHPTRRKFRELMADDDSIEQLDVVEDFVEGSGEKLRTLTRMNYNTDDNDGGRIYIKNPTRDKHGHANLDEPSYAVWWRADETHGPDRRQGPYTVEMDLLWAGHRPSLPLPIQSKMYFDTIEQARWAGASNAWAMARVLRPLPRTASSQDVEHALMTKLNAEYDRNIKKRGLFKGLGAKGDTWGTKREGSYQLFHDLVKEDPPRFDVAEDLLREGSINLRKAMGGEQVMHYYLDTKYFPGDPDYSVKERSVGGGFTPARGEHGGDDRTRASWISFYVKHGPSRYSFSKKLDKPIDADQARKMITATIWELSKRLAPFSNDVDEATIKRIAEKTVKQRHNIVKRYADLAGDILPGGKAAGRAPDEFDRKQLAIGTRVELEHTPNKRLAQEIAMDHLAEDSAYYRKLKRVHLDGSGLAAQRRREQETKIKDDDPGLGPPSQGTLQIGRKNDSYKDLPWSKVIAEAKKEQKADEARGMPGSNNLRLSLYVKHAPNDHSQQAHVSWDPFDVKGATKFAEQLIDDGGAQYASVEASAERPHDRSDRRPPRGHWTLASFEK